MTETVLCPACHHRWDVEHGYGATLCGDCWRKAQAQAQEIAAANMRASLLLVEVGKFRDERDILKAERDALRADIRAWVEAKRKVNLKALPCFDAVMELHEAEARLRARGEG